MLVLEKRWIAVIEDEEDLAEELVHFLQSKGYACVATGTVTDARLKLSNQKFVCIVLDIQLARESGDKVVRDLRSHPKHINHTTPIIVTSSHLDQSLVMDIRQHVQAALVKPYLQAQLLKKIEALIDGSGPSGT